MKLLTARQFSSGWTGGGSRRGFVLLAALWLLVALSAISLELALRGRERRLATRNSIEAAAARLAAESGLEHALEHLAALLRRAESLAEVEDTDFLADPWARPERMLAGAEALGQASYVVGLRDPGAALHLGTATQQQLRALLVALAVPAADADRLALGIVDVRARRRAPAAAVSDAAVTGAREASFPGANGFERLTDLRGLSSMTDGLLVRLAPYLTLVGPARINLHAAAGPVLLTLPGFGREAVAALENLRRSGGRLTNVHELALQLSPEARAALEAEIPRLAMLTTLSTDAVEVISEGFAAGGEALVRIEALVVRAGGGLWLDWKRVQ